MRHMKALVQHWRVVIPIMKIICIPAFFFASATSMANEFSCREGDLIERTIVFSKGINTFRFSKDCALRNDGEKLVLMKGNGYVNLEVYWPGLISYKKMTEISQDKAAASIDYVRSFITLSYGPTPLMISSAVDAYLSQKHHELFKEDDEYMYFIEKNNITYPSSGSIKKLCSLSINKEKIFG